MSGEYHLREANEITRYIEEHAGELHVLISDMRALFDGKHVCVVGGAIMDANAVWVRSFKRPSTRARMLALMIDNIIAAAKDE